MNLGPKRGLEKKLNPMAQTDRHTDTETHRHTVGHGNSMTELALWGRLFEEEKKSIHNIVKYNLNFFFISTINYCTNIVKPIIIKKKYCINYVFKL